jgi:hypothetical protein
MPNDSASRRDHRHRRASYPYAPPAGDVGTIDIDVPATPTPPLRGMSGPSTSTCQLPLRPPPLRGMSGPSTSTCQLPLRPPCGGCRDHRHRRASYPYAPPAGDVGTIDIDVPSWKHMKNLLDLVGNGRIYCVRGKTPDGNQHKGNKMTISQILAHPSFVALDYVETHAYPRWRLCWLVDGVEYVSCEHYLDDVTREFTENVRFHSSL